MWATPYEQTAEAYLPDLGSIESILRHLTMSDLKTLQLKFGIAPTAAMEHIALSALQSLDLRFECNVLGEIVRLLPTLLSGRRALMNQARSASSISSAVSSKRRLTWSDLLSTLPIYSALPPSMRSLVCACPRGTSPASIHKSALSPYSQIIDFRTWRIRGSVDAWVRWTRRSPLDAFAVDVWYFYEAPEDV